MFLTDAQIAIALANRLKQSPNKMPTYWMEIVTSSHASAYQDIVGAFVARGFNATQINAWDRGIEFERDISLYYCLVAGGVLEVYNGKELDRRRELLSVQIFVNQVWQKPAAATDPAGLPGQVMTGRIAGDRGRIREVFGPDGRGRF
jgi:hypothetical protein